MAYSLDDLRRMSEPDSNGCWIWQRGRFPTGYGAIWNDGKMHLVHRVVAALVYGPCPEGQEVMHSCDVRSCINPDHLSYGTSLENKAHMWAVGRGVRTFGEANGKSKFSDAQVIELRRRWEAGESQRSLARAFGMSPGNVKAIVHRVTWRHI